MLRRVIMLIVGGALLTGLVWLVMANWGNRPLLVSRKDPPQIKVDKSLHDLGTVAEGVEVPYIFKIRNVGGEPLKITNVHTSCGCTLINLKENVIGPGKSADLEVVMDTTMKQGVVRKSVDIESNDPKTPKLQVFLSANVLPRLSKGTLGSLGTSTMVGGPNPANPHAALTAAEKKAKIFTGNCASCHVQQGIGKKGEALFNADCAICHGVGGVGAPSAKGLLTSAWSDPAYAKAMKDTIMHGSKHSITMPGFLRASGGPLTEAEIDSLVTFLKKKSLSRK